MATRPRVLVVTPDFPPKRGGIQHLLHRVVSNWSRLQATVVTLGPDDGSATSPEGLDVVRLAAGRLGHRADVVRLNARAVRLARSLRPDVVLSAHVVASPAAETIARLLRIPYVQYLHGWEMSTRAGLTRRAISHARAVVAVSGFTAECASRIQPQARISLISPGVDPPHRSTEDRRSVGAPPTIVTVARLAELYKGHDVMLRALPLVATRIPTVRWVVVGDGPLRAFYASMAAGLGIDRHVVFTGAVSDAERDRILDGADVFAMVSRLTGSGAGEGFGIAYLEAGAHGLPVVAGRAGGAVDAVVDAETGVLVDPEDHVALAGALVDLLLDPERAGRMGAAGRAFAARHDWPGVSRQVEDLLLAVAAEG